jgi:menaquinone-dependent protoporphyrinogen oxidase
MRGIMSRRHVLLVYGTSYGHTAKIARHMAGALIAGGDRVRVVNAAKAPSNLDLHRYDAIIVGGSVIRGRHQREVTHFVRDHLAPLNTTPSAFFSVSGAAAGLDEPSHAEAQRFIDEFLGEAGWYPRSAVAIAGEIAYTKYNPMLRWIIRRRAKRMGGPTDTSRDHELTDWSKVERFVDGFMATVSPRLRPQPASRVGV